MSIDKYDRQTRLWGEGQLLICNSRIICFNSDGTATELLKNIVLAGIGYILIVDDKIVNENDYKENFFVNKSDIGKSRGQISLTNLLELNPDVKGACYETSPEEFLHSSLLQLQTFDLIISCNQQDKLNNLIFNYAEKFCQRVILVRNFGLINYMRIYENFHGNMQLRLPDNPVNDFRLVNPWKELKDFCVKFDLERMDTIQHKHIPWVIILIQALEKFKEKNEGRLPSTTNEKNEFKKIINSMRKYDDEINFDEALNFYYFANRDKLSLLTPEIEFIFDLLDKYSLLDLVKKTNNIMSIFFIICYSFKIYFKNYSTMPVVGNLPDMTSDTDTYVKLKKIYEEKSKSDREILTKMVYETIENLDDKNISLKKDQILSKLSCYEVNYIEILCKNWPQISLFHFSSIKEEESALNYNLNDFEENFNKTNFCWYLLVKSADVFYEKYNRYPGQYLDHDTFHSDVPLLKESFKEYLSINNKILPFELPEIFEDYLYEFCRFSNSNVVPANSIISSIASQEAIKLLTYQFKTINNTLIFDGINTTISVFKC